MVFSLGTVTTVAGNSNAVAKGWSYKIVAENGRKFHQSFFPGVALGSDGRHRFSKSKIYAWSSNER